MASFSSPYMCRYACVSLKTFRAIDPQMQVHDGFNVTDVDVDAAAGDDDDDAS